MVIYFIFLIILIIAASTLAKEGFSNFPRCTCCGKAEFNNYCMREDKNSPGSGQCLRGRGGYMGGGFCVILDKKNPCYDCAIQCIKLDYNGYKMKWDDWFNRLWRRNQ